MAPYDRTSTALELLRVITALPRVEWTRLSMGFEPAVGAMRARGQRCVRREPRRRVLLQRAIGWLDARVPGETNCYRRVLLEISLDAGAATEPVVIGLKAKGGPGSGHVWLASSVPLSHYDLKLVL